MKKKITAILAATLLALTMLSPMASFADDDTDVVITGKDGWYFYDSDRSIEDYKGDDLFTVYQLSNIRTRLVEAKDYFEAMGIPFVVFIAPNKEHIYPEYMPDEYGEPASYTRIEQLCDYLGDDLTVVTPLTSLRMAKELWPQYEYYYKTDTHWNKLGAYIGSRDLMAAIGYELPDFGSLKITSMTTPGNDLARKLDIASTALDTEYDVDGFGPYRSLEEDIDDNGYYINYHIEGAPARNMVILGDSFAMGMAPYIGQEFENVYIHRYVYNKSEILEQKPSVVVYELVERALDYMPRFELLNE